MADIGARCPVTTDIGEDDAALASSSRGSIGICPSCPTDTGKGLSKLNECTEKECTEEGPIAIPTVILP
jgi:hypothetical protein